MNTFIFGLLQWLGDDTTYLFTIFLIVWAIWNIKKYRSRWEDIPSATKNRIVLSFFAAAISIFVSILKLACQ